MPTSKTARIRLLTFGLTATMTLLTGCELQQRRMEVPTASGADDDLKDRFGLTADAQDPSERDEELGYGRWKAKPETEGTASPASPTRRRNAGGSPR